MVLSGFPELITSLPRASIPLPGIKAWLSQGTAHQIVFFEIPAGIQIPPHAHSAQWGTVLHGEVELTIGDTTRRYGPGDSYLIPSGVLHSARFLSDSLVIDVFDEPRRYVAEEPAPKGSSSVTASLLSG
jgi:quercetin dioxygenase-like cupin family protein